MENLPETTTMADAAEIWMRSKSITIPERKTQAWQELYKEWIEYAFKDFKY